MCHDHRGNTLGVDRFGEELLKSRLELFAARFGAGKLAGGGELTSVATGLALAARQRFGG